MNEKQKAQALEFVDILRARIAENEYKAFVSFDGRQVKIQALKGFDKKVSKLAAEVKAELQARDKK